MEIEVSTGEIVDKFTILTLKQANINDEEKLKSIIKELNYLSEKLLELSIPTDEILMVELLKVNSSLWKVEDLLRDFEKANSFGEEFIDLARSVYKLNDKRSYIKKEINIKYGSKFIEEKQYASY
jgi:hypothetical protein